MKTMIMLAFGVALVVTQTQAQTNTAAEGDIAEAVFRHQFQHNASGAQTNAAVYYVSIKGRDPDPAFLARFDGQVPPVKKKSEHGVSKKGSVVDPKSGRHALTFSVDEITMKSPDEAVVRGGYGEGPLSASGNTYTVKRQNGKWVVTGNVMNWISESGANPQAAVPSC
jgi:hypothetical protein